MGALCYTVVAKWNSKCSHLCHRLPFCFPCSLLPSKQQVQLLPKQDSWKPHLESTPAPSPRSAGVCWMAQRRCEEATALDLFRTEEP